MFERKSAHKKMESEFKCNAEMGFENDSLR